MGNSDSKKSSPACNTRRVRKSKSSYFGFSEFSLVNFASNLSSFSLRSGGSQRSAYSASRPWSRVSRHKWRQSTLNNPLEACKTAWPVPHIESAFLPEFKIKKKNDIKFEIVDLIAKGAYGRVFKVRKTDNNEFYAMKVLSKAQIIAEDSIQQVKDEVRIQSMCGHNPFIVNCPYFWQSRKKIFIVSTYVSGGELLALCRQYGPLPEELAAIYIAEIALALDFLHNSGVIYRDLKLENVLLDDCGHVQLIDFGLAKWLPYNCRTRTICGTPEYMAPEILSLESSSSYGHAVDWWSLGVLATVLITSKFPHVILRRMPSVLRRLAEIAFEVRKENDDKIKSDISASNINSDNESLSQGSRIKCDGLSTENDVRNTEIKDNFILHDVQLPDNEKRIFKIAENDNSSQNEVFNTCCINENRDEVQNEKNSKQENNSDNMKLFKGSRTENSKDEALLNPMKDESLKEILLTYPENNALDSYGAELSDGARDLIQRLLNPDPQKRLRSLLSLQNIRFFKDINFADIRVKKVAPVDVLMRYFPNGPIINKYHDQDTNDNFCDFDLNLIQ